MRFWHWRLGWDKRKELLSVTRLQSQSGKTRLEDEHQQASGHDAFWASWQKAGWAEFSEFWNSTTITEWNKAVKRQDRLESLLHQTHLKKQGSASVIAMLSPVFLFELLVAQTMTADWDDATAVLLRQRPQREMRPLFRWNDDRKEKCDRCFAQTTTAKWNMTVVWPKRRPQYETHRKVMSESTNSKPAEQQKNVVESHEPTQGIFQPRFFIID